MDLCSAGGVTVDQRPIEALTWCKITTVSKIVVGTVQLVLEEIVSKKDRLSFLLNDDDSRDFIDCSLEETQQLPARKETKSSSGLSSDTIVKDKAARRSSFLVPATQQLDDTAVVMPENAMVTGGKAMEDTTNVPNELNVDDDLFFIPETQQPDEDDRGGPSPTIDRISSVAFSGSERTEQPQTEEYFQMTMAQNEDENSNDGLFNNRYIEESQNLLQNVNESYKHVDVTGQTRKSILPDRSVDSISFQEHRNTTQDMSRLQWNETGPEHEQTVEREKPAPLTDQQGQTVEPDRSITPDLNFDEPAEEPPLVREEGSVTPDVDFDNLLVPFEAMKANPVEHERSVTVDEDEDEQENEISLNQEGCFPKPIDEPVPKDDSTLAVQSVEGVYDVETQAFDFNGDEVSGDGLDDDSSLKKPPETVPVVKECVRKSNSKHNVCVYDMETQALTFDDPYDVPTQPMEPRKSLSTPFVEPKSPGLSRGFKQSSSCVMDEFATQPMIPPEALLKQFSKANPSTSSRAADIETQPMSPPIDPADLLTQPMSPPKYLMENSVGVWEKSVCKPFDPYDQPTQLLDGSSSSKAKVRKPFVVIGSMIPIVEVVDIKKCINSPQKAGDPYTIATQPCMRLEDRTSNDPTQSQQRNARRFDAAETTTLEVSYFQPPINSTVRQSLLQSDRPLKDTTKQGLEISPSSNKENQTTRHARRRDESSGSSDEEGEDLDDEVCLAATLPIAELGQNRKDRSGARGKDITRRKAIPSPPIFKMPSERPVEKLNTPKPVSRTRKKSIELTEFLTPEHPLLKLPKPDSILMASGHMRDLAASHSRAAKSSSKYHFDDGSSESDEEKEEKRRTVFKKTNASVALEREMEKMKEISKQNKDPDGKRITGSRKRPVKVEERDKRKDATKRRRKSIEEIMVASSSSLSTDESQRSRQATRKEQEKIRETEKKKDVAGRKEETRKKKITPPKHASKVDEAAERISTRRNRRVEPHVKRPNDESIDYQTKSDKVTSSSVSSTASIRPATRTRKLKEQLSPEREQKPKTRNVDDRSTTDGGSEVVEKRVSKRQSKAQSSAQERSAVGRKKPDTTERLRRATATAKKVDEPSTLSSTNSGLMRDELGFALEARNRGPVADVSVSSSTGSEGSMRLARTKGPRLIFTRMSPEPYRKCIARAGT